MKRLALTLALLLVPAFAHAQCNGVFPANTVCGNAGGSPNTARATNPASFQGSAGGTNGQIQYNNSGVLGGFTTGGDATINTTTGALTITPLGVTNAKLALGAANTVKGTVNGTSTSDLAVMACSVAYRFTQWIAGTGWSCGINPVLPTRTIAATLDLSAFTVISTQGYSVAGDGGGATFQKIAGTFIDTRILTNAVTNNGTSGCTNNTYYGVSFSGGTGRGATGVVTVAGNVVTAISLGGQSTAGYVAGDVLTASPNITGCSTTVSTTVSTITTPTGSFTDSAANKWQIVFPTDGLNIKSMGVVFDWDGTDGAATDNFTTIQNALSFASYPTSTIVDLGGSLGGQVNLPKNTAMFCGGGTAALVVPYGVKVKGQGNYTSVLKPCDTWNAATNVIELCDKNTRLAGFGCMLEDFQVFMQRDVTSNAGVSLIYTNNAQHDAGMRRMVLYPGACRRGLTLENGYGGATLITMDSLEFKGGKAAAQCGGTSNAMIFINLGTTWVYFNNLNIAGLSASFNGPRNNGVVINGGFVVFEGIHPEQIINPVIINAAGGLANGQVRARMVTGGVDCVGMFTLEATNTPGNFMLGPPNAVNGCTRLVTNNQPAGANLTGPVKIDTIFDP
jgi:hypothetical protein